MKEDGEVPDGVDLDLLVRDALRELVGLGPLGPMLEDEAVHEIHVTRPDYVVAVKGGTPSLADPTFTSDEAVGRAIGRVAAQSGEGLGQGEFVVERRLARGASMIAIAPQIAGSWVLTVRKRRKVEVTLDDLVRADAMSRAMAAFLEMSIAARANILVAGSGAGAGVSLLGALASAARPVDSVTVLHDVEDISSPDVQMISVAIDRGERGAETARAAAKLGMDRLVVVSLGAVPPRDD